MENQLSSFDSLVRVTARVLGVPAAFICLTRDNHEHILAANGDKDFPWVAYTSVPLISPRGHVLGELAVADYCEREWTDADESTLRAMAVPIVNEIELRVRHTEQTRMTEELRQSAELFSAIIGTSSEAIICIDNKQRIVIFNHGAEQIFGYTESEVLGKPLDLLLPEDSRGLHRAEVDDFGRGPVTTRFKNDRRGIAGLRKNGEIFPAEASISRVQVNGEIFYASLLRDLTERACYFDALTERVRQSDHIFPPWESST